MKATIADPRTLLHCLRITAIDGTVLRLSEWPYPIKMDTGNVYLANQGYEFTAVTQTDDGGTLVDLEGILDAAGMNLDDILTQKWDGARVNFFATSWATPVEDEEAIGCGILGKTILYEARYRAELMHLIDALNVPTGRDFTALCPWVLFDETLDGKTYPYQRSRCTLNIDDYKIQSVIVTAVTDNGKFTAAGLSQAADYFSKGSLKFTSGDNTGLPSLKIKLHEAGGVLTLHDDAHFDVQVNDVFDIIPGCRKRLAEDCAGKFSNAPNNGSTRYLPTSDVITKVGSQ